MAVYFHIEEESLKVEILSSALTHVNKEIRERFQEATCELILVPNTQQQPEGDEKGKRDEYTDFLEQKSAMTQRRQSVFLKREESGISLLI